MSFSTLYFAALPHPSSFIKKNVLEKRRYNENLNIVSDWEFFLESAMTGVSYYHIDTFVSCFDATGISSSSPQKVMEERASVIERIVPKSIQYDMERLDRLSNAFADGQLSEINNLRNKNRFLHRIVTFDIWMLRIIDRIFCR